MHNQKSEFTIWTACSIVAAFVFLAAVSTAVEEERTLLAPRAHIALSAANQSAFPPYSAPALVH